MNVKKTYCIVEAPSNCGAYYDCWKEITNGLKAKGWHSSNSPQKSGIILLKQCCMTTEEIDTAIKQLVELAKKKVKAKIFLGECLSRTKEFVEVARKKLPELEMYTFTTPQEFFQQLGESYEKPQEHILSIIGDNAAIINIANGCNRKCSFCKVAYMDFPLKCVPMETVLQKIEMAKAKGTSKVVLNAMNSTQYNDNGRHLHDLLEAVLEIPGMYYQLNGIVMAELTDKSLEILRNPRFFSVQMEVQTFIPEVRKYMNVGEISNERILYIFNQMRGKHITSNLITGFYREKDKSFQEQLNLIRDNNLFFLTVTYLVATPGTLSATLNNPTPSQAQERMLKAIRILNQMRSNLAKEMIGKEQTCMVISEGLNKSSMLLAESGVLIRLDNSTLRMGQIVHVVPRRIESLFNGENQLLILSAEEKKTKKEFDEELMWNLLCAMSQEKIAKDNIMEGFNRSDLSLKEYCEKKFTEEMK